VIIALQLQPAKRRRKNAEKKKFETENEENRTDVAANDIHEVLGIRRNGGEEVVNLKHLRFYHPLVPLRHRRTRWRRLCRRRIRLFFAHFTHGVARNS